MVPLQRGHQATRHSPRCSHQSHEHHAHLHTRLATRRARTGPGTVPHAKSPITYWCPRFNASQCPSGFLLVCLGVRGTAGGPGLQPPVLGTQVEFPAPGRFRHSGSEPEGEEFSLSTSQRSSLFLRPCPESLMFRGTLWSVYQDGGQWDVPPAASALSSECNAHSSSLKTKELN